MKVVVKIGGTLLEDAADRLRLAQRLARHFHAGHQILVVHGGGKQLTGYLEQAGIASRFVEGLRVTTAEALDGVVKVFAGTVNHQLLAVLHQVGVPAVGISGIDGGGLVADKLVGARGQDWGYVGKIMTVNPRLWEVLLAARMLPVMACLAVGHDGQIYNVNADQAATACAVALRADALIFLTDVDGVHDGQGQLLLRLAADEIPALLRSGAVSGGMLAKLNAIREALARDVARVHIANGHHDAVLDSILAGPDAAGGTVLFSPLAATKKL